MASSSLSISSPSAHPLPPLYPPPPHSFSNSTQSQPLPHPPRHFPQTNLRFHRHRTFEKLTKLGKYISNLSLAEATILVDYLKEKIGVSAASFAPAAVVVAASGAGGDAPTVVEEKTEFDVVIDEVSSNARIATIKSIRAITSLALKEAKDLIEGFPKKFKEGVLKEEAEDAKKQLEEAGAKVSLV